MAPKISKTHQRVQEAARQRQELKGSQVVATDDATLLGQLTETWDDLSQLRINLAEAVMQVTMEMAKLAQDSTLQSNLGTHKAEFDKLMQTFWADSQHFAKRVAEIRVQHEHLSGRIQCISDYTLFTRLSLQYQNANDELQTLLGPTMSELVLIASEAMNAQMQSDLVNPAVISDVEVKEG